MMGDVDVGALLQRIAELERDNAELRAQLDAARNGEQGGGERTPALPLLDLLDAQSPISTAIWACVGPEQAALSDLLAVCRRLSQSCYRHLTSLMVDRRPFHYTRPIGYEVEETRQKSRPGPVSVDRLERILQNGAHLRRLSLVGIRRTLQMDRVAAPHLTHLDLSSSVVSQTGFLRRLPHLVTLNLSDTAVDNVDPIVACPGIQFLNLSATSIDSIRALASLPDLLSLDVSMTAVVDVSPLAACRRLRALYTHAAACEDLSALPASIELLGLNRLTPVRRVPRDCSNLQYLWAADLDDLDWLQQMPALVELELCLDASSALSLPPTLRRLWIANDNTDLLLIDCQFVSQLPQLEFLSLRMTSVATLPACPALQFLDLSYCEGLADLDWLSGCPALTHLDLSGSYQAVDLAPVDLAPVAYCPHLQVVLLNSSAVYDISPLANCRRLTHLSVADTTVQGPPLLLLFCLRLSTGAN